MASKAPGPRRLDEDEVEKLDAKVVVIQEEPLDGCIGKADQVEGLMPQENVHQKMFPMMSTDLAIDDHQVREDLEDELSEMYFSMPLMRSIVMSDVMCHCGGVMSSMASRPLGSSELCYHVKINQRGALLNLFGVGLCPRVPQKSLRRCQV